MLVILLTLSLCILTYFYFKTRFKYWKTRGVITLEHQNVIFGDISAAILARENFITTIQKLYREFKSRGCKFGGIYSLGYPMLLITDPEVSKCILVKDADHFLDRGVDYDEKSRPISAHLFHLNGEDWKFMRRKLSPTFTSGKLKTMFWIIEEHLDVLCNVIKRNSDDICLIDLFERLGMDVICHSAFGVNSNALENEDSEIHKVTYKVFHPKYFTILGVVLKHAFKNHANISLIVSNDAKCNDFFIKLVEDTVKYRKDNNIHVNDFLQLLIELMESTDGDAGLTLEKVSAQAFVFFAAAIDTGARSLNMLMYELGKNLKLQDELREEINNALEKNEGKFSYDVVMSCELLDTVVKEVLRIHAPVLYLNRMCIKEYILPGTSVVVEKGIPIIIPAYCFHQDPDHFPNPGQFDPQRFSKSNKENIKPYTYMPFGEGPRHCIGKRLGTYQLKTSVMKVIKQFEISVSSKTHEPLTFNPVTESLLLSYKQKIYFNARKL